MVDQAKERSRKENLPRSENAALDTGIMGLTKSLSKQSVDFITEPAMDKTCLSTRLRLAISQACLQVNLVQMFTPANAQGCCTIIGKAVDQTQEGTHIQLGVELARKFGEKEDVIHAIEAHHDDVTANTVEAFLVKMADAISASRRVQDAIRLKFTSNVSKD